ncbi:hypothetical protein V8E52_007979 [Russula decolorans]
MSKCSIPSDEVPALRRSRRRAGFHLAWPVSPVPASSLAQPYNSSWFVTDEPIPQVEDCDTKPKRKRHTKNVDRLKEWIAFRAVFLDEVLLCGKAGGSIKCKDCPSRGMLKCLECIVALHQTLPLHCVERWNGQFFDKDSLQNLGLHYQLGHSGASCLCPQPGPKNFTVFDASGPHFITINYWKTNLYNYYHTLVQRLDNANLSNPVHQYPEIHRRAGRAHDPAGVDATLNGELMAECPACPHLGWNLSDGWENAGVLLFLYTLYIAVDGNFKLKGKECHLTDVELMPRCAAYVLESDYKAHLTNHIDQPEINTCKSQHDALVQAAT